MNNETQSQDPMLEAKYRIAVMNGYSGPKTNASLNSFAGASEGMKRKFNAIGVAMANKGGLMRSGYAVGGVSGSSLDSLTRNLVYDTMSPDKPRVDDISASSSELLSSSTGRTSSTSSPYISASTVGSADQASASRLIPSSTAGVQTVAPQVQQEVAQLQPAQGTVSQQAQTTAAQQQESSVSNIQAAQGQAIMMDNPVQREIQDGELISGAADAQKAAQFTEQVQAAEATPSKQATVAGQLEGLMQDFEGGETPAWAAGAMRAANAQMAARGLGASSMAGQAVVQAAMEAALPIAQADASVTAQFEAQNLSNRQQRAMLAAQQRAEFMGMEFTQDFQARVQNSSRIADIANMNFTAEQQIALENSRAANTMELNNLSNRQATVMAEAAALSQMDMANLSNRQQAAVQNAQNFMQMDMANLSNTQQTAIFKTQQNLQALFTDQAAENAAAQFNAANENQTNQFFSNLQTQTSQFNAAQQNAMSQFDADANNAIKEFSTEMQQQRDIFNAQQSLVVAQANAQWRQSISTTNAAAENAANMEYARTVNDITKNNMDRIWQQERDLLSYAFQTAEGDADRATTIMAQKIIAAADLAVADATIDAAQAAAAGSFVSDVIDALR